MSARCTCAACGRVICDHNDAEFAGLVAVKRRRATSFSADERAVIRERRHGWEGATCATLAAIFNTTPQAISVICRREAA